MANDSETIREFLVALGFKVDEHAFTRFSGKLGALTASAAELGVAVVGAASAIETFTVKIARQFDNLYFASQRIQSSVQGIRGYEFAIQAMGGTAESARGALEGLAAAMRTNPGVAALIQNLTGKATGGRDRVAIMADLAQKFSQMPYYLAQRYASMMGIDEATLWQMTHNRGAFARNMAEPGRLYGMAGLNPNAVAERMHGFSVQFRFLEYAFSTLATVIGFRLLPVAERMTTWLQSTVEAMLSGNNGLSRFLKSLDWGAIKQETDFVQHAFEGLGIAIKSLDWDAIKRMSVAVGDFIKNLDYEAIGKEFTVFGESIAGVIDALGTFWAFLFGTGHGGSKAPTNPTTASGYAAGHVGGGPSGPRGIRNYNPTNLRGWGAAQTIDGFARFNDAMEGISAAAGNLLHYNAKHIDTVTAIISKWAPPSENDTAGYIADVTKRMGVGANQKLNLQDPRVMAGLINAMIWHENSQNPYSSELVNSAIASRFAKDHVGKNVTVHAKTDIHVSGAGDPKAVGDNVVSKQGRAVGDMVRNLRPALQ